MTAGFSVRASKGVKAARRAGGALVERVPKTAPQGRRFLPPFHRHRDTCGYYYAIEVLIQAKLIRYYYFYLTSVAVLC
jgi:hypothetical protein